MPTPTTTPTPEPLTDERLAAIEYRAAYFTIHGGPADRLPEDVAALAGEVRRLRTKVESLENEYRHQVGWHERWERQAGEWRERAMLYASQLQSFTNTAAPIAAAMDAPAGMILNMAVRDARRVLDGAAAALATDAEPAIGESAAWTRGYYAGHLAGWDLANTGTPRSAILTGEEAEA